MNDDNKFVLSDELLNQIKYFIQDKDATRVGKNLRVVFFDYLRFQTSGLPLDFDEILNDVETVLDMLQVIDEESKSWHNNVK